MHLSTHSLTYFACWLSLMALMHFPSVRSELLMFPASFSLSPVFWVREQRSDPARSHRASLAIQKNLADCKFVWSRTSNLMNPLANAKDSGNTDVLHSDDADGEDAVAEESKHSNKLQCDQQRQKSCTWTVNVFSSNGRSWTVYRRTLCSSPPAGQLV